MKLVAASGYFDPLHVGHIEYLTRAKTLGDKLVVIVNNDYQAGLKKGNPFMIEGDRIQIIRSLRMVDQVFLSIDLDPTVCKSLAFLKPQIFAKGGDRFSSEIPEAKVCKDNNIIIVDGLGEKIRSSSKYIEGSPYGT